MKQFQRVKLNSDKYINEGLEKGAVGYILNIYDSNHYEVEFSDSNGITIMLCSFSIDELELAE